MTANPVPVTWDLLTHAGVAWVGQRSRADLTDEAFMLLTSYGLAP